MIRVKRPNLKAARRVVALAFVFVLVGGVAALVLSNNLAATFQLHSEKPLSIAWHVDPSSAWVVPNAPITSYVNYTNLSPKSCSNVLATVTLTCPVGMTVASFNMFLGPGGALADWTHVDNVFTATKALGAIGPSAVGSWFWQMTITPGALDGVYGLSIVISGDFT